MGNDRVSINSDCSLFSTVHSFSEKSPKNLYQGPKRLKSLWHPQMLSTTSSGLTRRDPGDSGCRRTVWPRRRIHCLLPHQGGGLDHFKLCFPARSFLYKSLCPSAWTILKLTRMHRSFLTIGSFTGALLKLG